MIVDVDVRCRQGAFQLDARFATDSTLTALFGRSGAGKTTVLQLISGLLRPDEGRIVVDGTVLADTARGIFVPAHRRRVGYVFQDARLFPHRDVRGNLLYGHRPHAGERGPDFAEIVAMLGLEPLLDRRIHGLSGGERQRIAIGRALLANPRLLLFDEPLASVDHARRDDVLKHIEWLRDELNLPIVYVSHEVVEVARLASTVVALAEGRVTGCGTAGEVLARVEAGAESDDDPLSVLEAIVLAHEDRYAMSIVRAGGGELHVPRVDLGIGAALRVVIRARDVMLATQAPVGVSAQNVVAATIIALREIDARSVDATLRCGDAQLVARVTRRAVEALSLVPGMAVHALIKSVAIDRSARARHRS